MTTLSSTERGEHTPGIVERLREDLEVVQQDNRPLPWVVHSGCSYRRIASVPTRENFRTFPDGNVLSAYNQRSDNHPDLSMPERQLEALVRLVNALPEIADLISELVGALEAFVDGDNGDSIDTRYENARQTIAKARGGAE